MLARYNLFIFEGVKAHVSASSGTAESLHYQGMGPFMLSGKTIDRAQLFKPSC